MDTLLHTASLLSLRFALCATHTGSPAKTQNNSSVNGLYLRGMLIKKQHSSRDVIIWTKVIATGNRGSQPWVFCFFFLPPTFISLSFPNQFKEFQTDDVTNSNTATGVTLPTYTLGEIAFSRRRTWIKRLKCFIWICSWMDWSRFQSGRAEAVTSSWRGRAKWKPALPGYRLTQSLISALVAATDVTRSKEVQTKDNKQISFFFLLNRASCFEKAVKCGSLL